MLRFHRLGRFLALSLILLLPAWTTGPAEAQENRPRVLVVGPGDSAEIPIAPGEVVRTHVLTILGEQVTVIVIEPPPPKPFVNLLLPNGNNVTFSAADHPPGTQFRVVQIRNQQGPVGLAVWVQRGGNSVRHSFPLGTEFTVDPPGPVSTLTTADAFPVSPLEEAAVLGQLGLPDTVLTEVFEVPLGILLVESPLGLNAVVVDGPATPPEIDDDDDSDSDSDD